MPAYFASIPVYYFVTLSSHVYAQTLLKGSSNPRAYDNSNPRASTNTAVFQKALGPAGYKRYERARAAHQNGLENFPFFVATVLALHQLGWHENGLTGAAAVAWGNILARVLYTIVFVQTESQRKSYWRSVIWAANTLLNATVLVVAALRS